MRREKDIKNLNDGNRDWDINDRGENVTATSATVGDFIYLGYFCLLLDVLKRGWVEANFERAINLGNEMNSEEIFIKLTSAVPAETHFMPIWLLTIPKLSQYCKYF